MTSAALTSSELRKAGIPGALRLLHVALDKLAPLGALRVGALERVAPHRASFGSPARQTLVGGAGPASSMQVFVEHAGQLGEELGFARGPSRGHELDLEQLRDGLVLAPALVSPARGFEELRELVRLMPGSRSTSSRSSCHAWSVIGVVLQKPQGALDRLRAHPSPGGFAHGRKRSQQFESPEASGNHAKSREEIAAASVAMLRTPTAIARAGEAPRGDSFRVTSPNRG